MKEVLEYIMEQGLDISGYHSLINPIMKRFLIRDLDGFEATENFIDTIIFWEKHFEVQDSLESFLKERFTCRKL